MKKGLATIITLLLVTLLFGCGEAGTQAAPSPAEPSGSASEQVYQTPPPAQTEEPVEDSSEEQIEETPQTPTGKVTAAFTYARQRGSASNQFAVWVEDMNGVLQRTLYATEFTVEGGYEYRPDSIPLWVERSELAAMTEDETDAVTGATPREGELSYVWDLTDETGATVPSGEYRVLVEGSLRWKNRVLMSGVIKIGGGPAETQAETEYTFEGDAERPPLSEISEEAGMLSGLTLSYDPES